jgi:hypothetical protein
VKIVPIVPLLKTPDSPYAAAQSTYMKTILLVAILAGLTGCAQSYKVTLNNNNTFTTRGKPKYNDKTQCYEYKDNGKLVSIPAIRVKEIEAQ